MCVCLEENQEKAYKYIYMWTKADLNNKKPFAAVFFSISFIITIKRHMTSSNPFYGGVLSEFVNTLRVCVREISSVRFGVCFFFAAVVWECCTVVLFRCLSVPATCAFYFHWVFTNFSFTFLLRGACKNNNIQSTRRRTSWNFVFENNKSQCTNNNK